MSCIKKGERCRLVLRPAKRYSPRLTGLLDKSLCQVVPLPSNEREVTIYFDEEASKATTEATGRDKELNNILMTLYLERFSMIHKIHRSFGLLGMSRVYVMNLYV